MWLPTIIFMGLFLAFSGVGLGVWVSFLIATVGTVVAVNVFGNKEK